MKVRYTSGDRAGQVDYLGFHEAQAALIAEAVEIINDEAEQVETGNESDKAEVRKPAPAAASAPDVPPDTIKPKPGPGLGEAEQVKAGNELDKAEVRKPAAAPAPAPAPDTMRPKPGSRI